MKYASTIALASAVAVLLTTAATTAQEMSSLFGVYVYPAKGQNSSQQATDESVCYKSAKAKTGVDPANLPPAAAPAPTQHAGGAVRGGARGAAAGAVIGAIAGNAGQGAAIGAAAGGISGYSRQKALNNAEQHYAQANVQAQQSQNINNFRRAFAACIESKGYTVK
jgi:Glycine-zipper domain